MAMKGYTTFPKALALLKPYHQIIYCHIQDTYWVSLTPIAAMQSVYSAATADWAKWGMRFAWRENIPEKGTRTSLSI